MAWKLVSTTPVEDTPTDIAALDAATGGAGTEKAQQKFKPKPFKIVSAVPAEDDAAFDEIAYAAQNEGNEAAQEYAFNTYKERAARDFKDHAGKPYAHYKAPSMTLPDVAKGFGSFVRGSVMAAPRLVKQGYQAATDSPNAATTTAENVIGAQMAGQNLEHVMRAMTDWGGNALPEGYAAKTLNTPAAIETAAELAPRYLAARPAIVEGGASIPYAQARGGILNAALAKLKTGQPLTPEEDAEAGMFAAALDPEAAGVAELRGAFGKKVQTTREGMKLAGGTPLDTGMVADYIQATQGVKPSEALGPENLQRMGAAPVDPGAVAGVAAAADPVNAALIRVPGLPGARRVGGALVAGAGKTLEGVGALARKVTPTAARGATAAAGIYALAGGDVDRAAKIGATLAGFAGLRKIGAVGKFFSEAGQEAMTAGAKVAPATAALAATRRAGQTGALQTAKVGTANLLIDMAAMPVGALPINAGFSGGDMQSFWAMTAGSPLFGVFGAFQGIKPQLVNAIRPQMRAEGQARYETFARGDKWQQAAKTMVDALPEEQRNAIYEMSSALGGLETKGPGGQTGVADLVPLSAKDYAAFKAENGLGEGRDRGVAMKDGKAYVNAEHASAQKETVFKDEAEAVEAGYEEHIKQFGYKRNPDGTITVKTLGNAFQMAHSAGHEFGGHTALNIMRAVTGKGGPLYEAVMRAAKKELGTMIAPDGKGGGKFKPSKEFQQFIDGYNAALIKGGSPKSAQISSDNPAAIEEFIAETAGRIFSAKGAADIVIPEGIRDKVDKAIGQLFSGALGVGGQSNFGHVENRKVTGMYLDALRQIVDPAMRRVTLADDPAQTAPQEPTPAAPAKPALAANPARTDAELALVALGWPKAEASRAAQTLPGNTAEEIVKAAVASKVTPAKPPVAPIPAAPAPAAPAKPAPTTAPAAPQSAFSAESAPVAQQTAPAAVLAKPAEAPLEGRITPTPVRLAPALAPQPEPAKAAPSFETKVPKPADVNAADDAAAEALIAEAANGGPRLPAILDLATAAAGDNKALLQKRTDPLTGKVSYAGRLDSSLPEHRALIKELGLPQEQVEKLTQAQDAGGEAKFVDYWSASKLDPDDITGKQRALELAADKDKRSRELLQKNKAIIFTGVEVYPGSGKAVQKGISVDKFVANIGKLLEAAKTHKLPIDYEGINDPKIQADLQGYVANHKANVKGDGSGVVAGKEMTPGYEPYLIPRNRFDLLNAAFHIETSTAKTRHGEKVKADEARRAAGEKVRKRPALKPETDLKAEDAQRRALENEWQVDDATGDTNPFRAMLNREGKLTYADRRGTTDVLETVFENLSPDMIDAIRDEPNSQPDIVRDVGFTGDARGVLAKGLPDWKNVEAGFMPDTPEFKTWFGNSKAVDKTGKPLVLHHVTGSNAPFHAFEYGKLLGGEDRYKKQTKPGFGFSLEGLSTGWFTSSDTQFPSWKKPDKSNVISAYLKLENPAVFEADPIAQAGMLKEKSRLADITQRIKDAQENKTYIGHDEFDSLRAEQKALERKYRSNPREEEEVLKLTKERDGSYVPTRRMAEIKRKLKELEHKVGDASEIKTRRREAGYEDPFEQMANLARVAEQDFPELVPGAALRAALIRDGHDGIILKQTSADTALGSKELNDWFIPFHGGTQIKSATGNSGAYDPANPDIRFMPDAPKGALSKTEEPEELSLYGYPVEQSDKRVPRHNWDETDLYGGAWTPELIREQFKVKKKEAAIYKSLVDISELDPRLAEVENYDRNDPDSETSYDWSELQSRGGGGPPPVIVTRNKDGKIQLEDGNHRVHFWGEQGYEFAPAWVIDKYLPDQARKRGMKSIGIDGETMRLMPDTPKGVLSKTGEPEARKVTRFTHRDGKGLLDRSAWDLSKLSDAEELALPELLDYGMEQPRGVEAGKKFYFTKDGLKKHAKLLRLIAKASKSGGLVKEETTLTGEPAWESGDGQVAFMPDAGDTAPLKREDIKAAAEAKGLAYDGPTEFGDVAFHAFSDTVSKPGTRITFNIEGEVTPAKIAAGRARKLKEWGIEPKNEEAKPDGRAAINAAMAKHEAGEITRAELAKVVADNSPHFMPNTEDKDVASFWIHRAGTVVGSKHYDDHAELAREVLNFRGGVEAEDKLPQGIYGSMTDAGFFRGVRQGNDIIVETNGRPIGFSQRKRLKEMAETTETRILIDDGKGRENPLFDFRPGKEGSFMPDAGKDASSFATKRGALADIGEGKARFMPSDWKMPVSKEQFRKDVTDGNPEPTVAPTKIRAWLTPEGRFLNVDDHNEVVPMYGEDTFANSDDMMKAGFIRIMKDGRALHAEHFAITPKQRKAVEDAAIELGTRPYFEDMRDTGMFMPDATDREARAREIAKRHMKAPWEELSKEERQAFLNKAASDEPGEAVGGFYSTLERVAAQKIKGRATAEQITATSFQTKRQGALSGYAAQPLAETERRKRKPALAR